MPSSITPALRRPSTSPVRAVSYDTVKAGKPPIPIQVAPKPSQARLELHPALGTTTLSTSSEPAFTFRSQRSYFPHREQDDRRDSGLGTTASTKRQSRATTVGTDRTDRTDADSTKSANNTTATTATTTTTASSINMHFSTFFKPEAKSDAASQKSSTVSQLGIERSSDATQRLKQGEALQLPAVFTSPADDLPSFSFEDLSQPDTIEFSKRGSLLFKGKRPSTSPSQLPRTPSPGPSAGLSTPQNQTPQSSYISKPGRQISPDPPQRSSSPPLNKPSASSAPTVPLPESLAIPDAVPRHRNLAPAVVSRLSSISSRALSSEEEVLSQRIRSMYNAGSEEPQLLDDAPGPSSPHSDHTIQAKQDKPGDDNAQYPSIRITGSPQSRSSAVNPMLEKVVEREENEVAGGMEDWQGVESSQVDRYGFITKTDHLAVASPDASNLSLPATASNPEAYGHTRMATQLRLATDTPRRSRSFRSRIGARRLSAVGGSSGLSIRSHGDRRSVFARPPSSQASYHSQQASTTSRIRRVANHLPQNKGRRAIDEAGDMLTLPPGLAQVAEAEALKGIDSIKAIEARSLRERQREEKWRKMAKAVRYDHLVTKTASAEQRQALHALEGSGMNFSFDMTDSKLISRTWKGIPDRWRATAWWSFLATSAKKDKNSRSEQELVKLFEDLQKQSSPDDVQIDLDVPRTIGGHVMFRKRYRGGQRLLFRVLHALSLYFPDPGYVQGMAALAATFLCYFQEDLAFVMLVRMWELRGLAKLYRAGFEGLMTALGEFEHKWLDGGTVGEKLKELGITPTAYGTRWYLTVFNYSIPFSAQLRVWDVFLLLGDAEPSLTSPASRQGSLATPETQAVSEDADVAAIRAGFNGSLDVLHATSAALIDATREIILDSDFENAMKTLTSWIPVRDEDLLMKVAKVEWKMHKSQQQQQQQQQQQRGR